MRKIKFVATGHSHTVGNFASGDIATVDNAAAKHFVEEARAAVYDDAAAQPAKQAVQTSATDTKPATTGGATRKKGGAA